jgi:hypothetical protein
MSAAQAERLRIPKANSVLKHALIFSSYGFPVLGFRILDILNDLEISA